MSSRGLGKGLSALIGNDIDEVEGAVTQVLMANITPNLEQPRTWFAEGELEELSESIAQNGILQPILLCSKGENKYQIIAGERRWKACKKLDLQYIPAIIKDVSEVKALELALIENIQRENLQPLEEARSYRKLISKHGYTQEKIAEMVSKSRSHVANLLRLQSLPKKAQELLEQGKISLGHAKLLMGLENALDMAEIIIASKLSVKETAECLKSMQNSTTAPKNEKRETWRSKKEAPSATNDDFLSLEESLSKVLRVKVNISRNKKGATIVLDCDSMEDVDRMLQKLTGF
jgi:ParB family chromosome partitioning protein